MSQIFYLGPIVYFMNSRKIIIQKSGAQVGIFQGGVVLNVNF